MDEYPQGLAATTIVGAKVINSAGEELGNLKELMVDLTDGRIAYAVLSFGGFLGIGDKLFAIPWEAMTLDAAAGTFVLNIEKEKLENAPGFDKDYWPDNARYEESRLLDTNEHHDK